MDIPKSENPELIRAHFNMIAKIVAEVAREAGITPEMITGDRRSPAVVAARHLAIWRAARETGASLKVIGRAFGDRDRSTILAAIGRHEERTAQSRPTERR